MTTKRVYPKRTKNTTDVAVVIADSSCTDSAEDSDYVCSDNSETETISSVSDETSPDSAAPESLSDHHSYGEDDSEETSDSTYEDE